jgi:hypothetical protein
MKITPRTVAQVIEHIQQQRVVALPLQQVVPRLFDEPGDGLKSMELHTSFASLRPKADCFSLASGTSQESPPFTKLEVL